MRYGCIRMYICTCTSPREYVHAFYKLQIHVCCGTWVQDVANSRPLTVHCLQNVHLLTLTYLLTYLNVRSYLDLVFSNAYMMSSIFMRCVCTRVYAPSTCKCM